MAKNDLPEKLEKQPTVLKQLNDQSLYPLQERIGIYIVAALSLVGLVLIVYSGSMAFISNVAIGSEVPVDIDIDDIQNMLDDLEELLAANNEEDEEYTQDESDLHEYVDEVEDEDEDDDLDEDYDVDEDEEEDYGTDDDDEVTSGPATINDDMIGFYTDLTLMTRVSLVHEGDAIEVVDLNYNAYWARVRVETNYGTLTGFVQRQFIDMD